MFFKIALLSASRRTSTWTKGVVSGILYLIVLNTRISDLFTDDNE